MKLQTKWANLIEDNEDVYEADRELIEKDEERETKDKLNNKQEEIVIMEENSTEEKVIKNKHSLKYRAQAELIDKVIIILGFNFIAVFLEEIIFNVFLPKDYFKEKNKI